MPYPEFGIEAIILGDADLWQARNTSHADRFDTDYITNSIGCAVYYSHYFSNNIVYSIAMRHAHDFAAVLNQILRERQIPRLEYQPLISNY